MRPAILIRQLQKSTGSLAKVGKGDNIQEGHTME
jgi:hypothetical protein